MKVGERHGRLIALHKLPYSDKKGQALWRFECDCGKKPVALATLVNIGKTKSCGCLRREITGNKNRIHGMSGKNRFYKIWRNARERCRNPNNPAWKNYGGRGITFCKRWDDFKKFHQDMHPSYLMHLKDYSEKNTVIDRTDNEKGYMPSNCAWVTRHESRLNSRRPDYELRTLKRRTAKNK